MVCKVWVSPVGVESKPKDGTKRMGSKQTATGGTKAMLPPPPPKKTAAVKVIPAKKTIAAKAAKTVKVVKAVPAAAKAKGKGNGHGKLPGNVTDTAPQPQGEQLTLDGAGAAIMTATTDADFAAVMGTVVEQTGIAPATLPTPAPAPIVNDGWKPPYPVGAVPHMDGDDLDANPARNGRPLSAAKVRELAADFKARIDAGLDPQLQEIAAYYDPRLIGEDRDKPRVVFGFHRVHACDMYNKGKTGMDRMTLRVRIVKAPEGARGLLDNFTENSVRNELSPVSEMRYMTRMRDEFGMDQKAIAKEMRVSAPLVSLRLSLERLPAKVLALIENGTIPVKAAYQLAQMDNPDQREIAVSEVMALLTSVDTASRGEDLGEPTPAPATTKPAPIKVEKVTAAINKARGKASATVKAKGKRGPKSAADIAAAADVETAAALAPAPLAIPDSGPKKLSLNRVEKELQNAAMYSKTPAPLKAVLRVQLQWLMGMKTTDRMLRAIAAAIDVDITDLAIPGLTVK